MEATALGHGFLPETASISNAEMEKRLTGSLPHLAYMVSRPRQASNLSEDARPRCGAAPRPYWMRDWQQDFGGFTKVYEYMCIEQVKRKYTVAFVTRTRIARENACLCFPLVSKIPDQNPWVRDPDMPDPSKCDLGSWTWRDEWVALTICCAAWCGNYWASTLDDDMLVQCLPVPKADAPQWSYREVPKTSIIRNFDSTPLETRCFLKPFLLEGEDVWCALWD